MASRRVGRTRAYARRVDPFAVIVLGALAGLVLALLLLGRLAPGRGADGLGPRPPRSVDGEAASDAEDLGEMLEAANRRRRSRGAPELSEAGLRADVVAGPQETLHGGGSRPRPRGEGT
jgi:hypothetical protein